MAVVDAKYNFIWASVGAPGSHSDGGIFKGSSLHRRIEAGTLGIPPDEPLLRGDDLGCTILFCGE